MYVSREVRVSHGDGGGRGEERRGGWVATVPCQALRGRLFIPWICIFCPLPFLTSCYPASMISSVGSSYCSRSSTRHSLCLRTRACVSSYVCMCQDICPRMCVSAYARVCTYVRTCAPRRRIRRFLCVLVCKSNMFARKLSPFSPLLPSPSLCRVSLHFNRSSECTLDTR